MSMSARFEDYLCSSLLMFSMISGNLGLIIAVISSSSSLATPFSSLDIFLDNRNARIQLSSEICFVRIGSTAEAKSLS